VYVVALAVGAVLVASGGLKLQNPRVFASTLRKLGPAFVWNRLPRRVSIMASLVIAAGEIVVGTGLAVATGELRKVVVRAALALTVGFTLAVGVAIRRSAQCGCFGPLSGHPAGRWEAARAGGMLAACIVLVATVRAHDAVPIPPLAVPLLAGGALLFRHAAGSSLVRRRRRTGTQIDVIVTEPVVLVPEFAPPPDELIELARRAPEVATIEARLAAAGATVDWSGARVGGIPGSWLVSVGEPTGATLLVRLTAADAPVSVVGAAGDLRFVARKGRISGGAEVPASY